MNLLDIIRSVNVRFDTWEPEYKGAIQVEGDVEGEPTTNVHPDVELPISEWKPITPESYTLPSCVAFIDGVRRIDARITGESEGRIIYGAFGTFSAGGIVMKLNQSNLLKDALYNSPVIKHLFLLGKDMSFDNDYRFIIKETGIEKGNIEIIPIKLENNDSNAPVNKLQEIMRHEEGYIAEKMAKEGKIPLVIRDGPLHRLMNLEDMPILGYIKTLHKFYISPDLMRITSCLKKGQRTPIFKIEYPEKTRGTGYDLYSWYLRLNDLTPKDTYLSGIVRLEVQVGIGKEKAKYLADITTSILPNFASTRERDPRAPQNLLPIECLEKELRRRMGNGEIMRRRFEKLLFTAIQPT